MGARRAHLQVWQPQGFGEGLRAVLSRPRAQTAEALRERAARIYDKYGNVMLETAGMTKTGIERKATCRALFSKLLYLAGPPAASRVRGNRV